MKYGHPLNIYKALRIKRWGIGAITLIQLGK